MSVEPRRVLLAWELGSGRGHVVAQSRIAAQLMARGHHVTAIMRDVSVCRELAEMGARVRKAPSWAPQEIFRPGETRSSVTLTDSLAQAGLGDREVVRRLVADWRGIIDEVRPHLVVADYAPLAALMARGRIPVLQHGVGYCLPPDHLTRLPELHAFRKPLWREEELLENINSALEEAGQAPLSHFGMLFSGEALFVSTFPLLDPYVDERPRDAEGPLMAAPPLEARADAKGIFGYLHPSALMHEHVVAGLEKLGGELMLYAPGSPDPLLRRFAAAGVEIHTRPLPMAQTLAGKRLLLHQGSAGVAAEALAAGVAQYTLPTHVENYLNGQALQAAGVSRSLNLFDPAARLDAAHVRQVARDPDMAMVAAAAGRMHRAMLEDDPLTCLMERALALL